MTEEHATVKAQVPADANVAVASKNGGGHNVAEQIRIELAAAWGEMGAAWGVTPAIARVQAYLMARQEPLTEREVREALGLSHRAGGGYPSIHADARRRPSPLAGVVLPDDGGRNVDLGTNGAQAAPGRRWIPPVLGGLFPFHLRGDWDCAPGHAGGATTGTRRTGVLDQADPGESRKHQRNVPDRERSGQGNAGPNAVSSFHVVGEIFDKVGKLIKAVA